MFGAILHLAGLRDRRLAGEMRSGATPTPQFGDLEGGDALSDHEAASPSVFAAGEVGTPFFAPLWVCNLVIGQGVDTTTPAGKALFQMMGVFAEFERAMIRERVCAWTRPGRGAGSSGAHRWRRRLRTRSAPLARPAGGSPPSPAN